MSAAVIVPGLFALSHDVLDNSQMSTFVAFGGFATLVMASFRGSRRDQAVAYLGLALTGSVLLTIGTAVAWSVPLVAVVTVPVVFAVLFAGVLAPNAAAGATAALLAYVLPAASAGTIGTVPSRLAGWWLASTVAASAMVLLSRPGAADRLRKAAGGLADAIAEELDATARGDASVEYRAATRLARETLLRVNTATPYRPTGLTTPSQALASVTEVLEWSSALLSDLPDNDESFGCAAEVDRRLLRATGGLFHEVAALLHGRNVRPDLDRLERLRAECADHLHSLRPDDPDFDRLARCAFHARALSGAARSAAADSVILARRADPATIAAARLRWFGANDAASPPEGGPSALAAVSRMVTGNASLRSAWFQSSVRGAVAVAAAVAVADLAGLQHGFWVVLGTLSVLRSNAVSTGATAMRAVLGTLAGFVVGASLILGIGANTTVLWAMLPIAVLFASYVPDTAPFAVGQAGFTVLVSVLYNLIVPVGWKVGVVRVEDVAIGCAVSLGVGILFWPQGAVRVVGDDLAEAFRRGGDYLTQATAWALGLGQGDGGAGPAAVTAGMRLDEALRGFLAERGAKRVPRGDLWRLVGGAQRLRLTANSLAGLSNPVIDPDPARAALVGYAEQLADWYWRLAAEVGGVGDRALSSLRPGDLVGPALGYAHSGGDSGRHRSSTLWVEDHLAHLRQHLPVLVAPAETIAETRRAPWWR